MCRNARQGDLAPYVAIRPLNTDDAQLDEWLDRFADATALADAFPDLAH